LIRLAITAEETFRADSITSNLNSYHSFYLCNRLFLLNLASIYTSGFECPDKERIIPELQNMLEDVKDIYSAYNESFSSFPLPENYLSLYNKAISFVQSQQKDFTKFDHFTFIKDYVNPLFSFNQQLIVQYHVQTKSYVDFTLSNTTTSVFDKSLYFAQSTKGIYRRINDRQLLAEIDSIGKLLFYDPILSGNNQRSCVSCHKFFTDTAIATAFQFNHEERLTRNTPTLLNTNFNHLLHLDGKILTLQEQAHTVITNPIELGSKQEDVLKKIMSCSIYKKAFKKYLKYTPEETQITFDHIASAITMYYGKFSQYYSPFDEAFNSNRQLTADVISGFNLYMSKAQCATCHFVPSFSGIKPPYSENEFEVIGVPADLNYTALSNDKGRYEKNPAPETLHAFRTATLRNTSNTKPYMHNGIFKSLEEVIDFYDAGGGLGHGLKISNQTLSGDSLHLTSVEKTQLIAFLKSLNEKVIFENPPSQLPASENKELNKRKVGGEY
jgi:cytochrome c peroxidase